MSYDFSELEKAVKNWTRSQPEIDVNTYDTTRGPHLVIYAKYDKNVAHSNYKNLDKLVSWAAEKLENWPGVVRISYNIWIFSDKREREKFITLFKLYQTQ